MEMIHKNLLLNTIYDERLEEMESFYVDGKEVKLGVVDATLK